MSETAFVGREAELGRLHALLEEILAGSGRSCFVAGEAGSGKTALTREFIRQALERHENVVVAVGRCNAQTGMGQPYLPFMEILSLLTGEDPKASAAASVPESNAARLETLARGTAKVLIEFAPDIVGALIPGSSLVAKIGKSIAKESGILAKLEKSEQPERAEPVAELDAQKIFKQYTDLLANVSKEKPIILVLDDMHWADSASISLFSHLCMKLRESNVLLLGTYRPNDLALGRGDDRHPLVPVLNESKRVFGDIFIDMDVIEQQGRRQFVAALIDAEPNLLGEEFRNGLFSHTNGHPLFTVELLQSLKENGNLARDSEGRWVQNGELDWAVLPPRVEGVIEERIGRLEEKMREILVTGSIEGQSFTAQVVAHLHEMTEREILKYLSQELEKRHRLVKEGNTEKIGKNWLSKFSFSHALFQQYLYNELSERQKMILHGDIAELLEEFYKDKLDSVQLQLARHYEMAGEAAKAAACLVRAGRQDIRISAYEEARIQLLRALALIEEEPEDEQRDRLELDIQLSLSAVYKAKLGWDSPEVKKACYRARELGGRLNLQSQLAPIIFGLWASHLVQLELRDALSMAEEYRQLAESMGDRNMQLHAHVALGNTYYWLGRVEESYASMAEAYRLYSPQHDYIMEFGQDPRIFALMFMGFCAWLLGRPGEARERQKEMMAVAEGLSHHFSMVIALYASATLDYHLQDLASMKLHTERLVQLSREHHFPLYHGLGMVYLGWCAAMEGEAEAGIRQMTEGFEQWICKYGGKVTHSLYCVMMAEALRRAGQWEEGLAVVDKGLEVVRQCDELCYEPELHRLKGDLLFGNAEGRDEEIEAAYRKAIEIGHAQKERTLELRSGACLARFLHDRGRGAEASALLGGIRNGVAEGLDDAGMKEAEKLLSCIAGN